MRQRTHFNTSARLQVVLVLLMAFTAIQAGVRNRPRVSSIDFYHIWGIAASRAIDRDNSRNPYAEPERTASVLNRYAAQTGGQYLRSANQRRLSIDPTGTPLFYASFALLPLDFAQAHIFFRVAQYVALAGGIVLLLRCFGLSWINGGLVAGVAVLTHGPFQVDLRVGNVNAFQFLLLVALAWTVFWARGSGLRGYALACGLAFAVLWKPNVLPVIVMLAGARLAGAGARRMLAEVGVGGALGALLLVLTSLWFGDWRIWSDWYQYLYGGNPEKLVSYLIIDGNVSPSLLLSSWTGLDAYAWTLALLALLGATASWAVVHGARRSGRGVFVYAREAISDPWFSLALGVTVALAASPLLWTHYLVWGAIAPLWLLLGRGCWDNVALLGAVTLLINWESPLYVLTRAGNYSWTAGLQSFAWIAVWGGLLLHIAQPARLAAR